MVECNISETITLRKMSGPRTVVKACVVLWQKAWRPLFCFRQSRWFLKLGMSLQWKCFIVQCVTQHTVQCVTQHTVRCLTQHTVRCLYTVYSEMCYITHRAVCYTAYNAMCYTAHRMLCYTTYHVVCHTARHSMSCVSRHDIGSHRWNSHNFLKQEI